MRRLAAIAWLLAGLLWSSLASAEDLIVSRGVLEDPGGTLDIAEIVDREFRPTAPSFAGGFSDKVHWFRIQVRAPASGRPVMLRIRPTVLDDIRLFEAAEGDPSGWKVRVTGDRHPFDARDRPGTSLGFVIRVGAPQATYYLRLQTASTTLFNVQALDLAEADRADHLLDLLQFLFAGLMLWPLLWAVQNYAVDRDPVVGFFALHQLVYTLYGLGVTGYFAVIAPATAPELADTATSFFVCAVLFTGALFSRALLRLYSPPRALALGLDLLPFVFPLQILAMLAGHTRTALAVSMVLIIASRWYFVLVSLFFRTERVPSRRFVQATMLVLALLVTAILPVMLGWAVVPGFVLHDMFFLIAFGLTSTGLLVGLLHARLSRSRDEARQAAVELLYMKRALELEQSLKERAEQRANTDYLTGLFNRRHFVELAERELARSARYDRPLSLLMLDIDHFKRVNDTRGHGTGDEVLRQLSQVLRDELRDLDIVGRIGGEEFAILLVETAGPEAEQVAERVRASVERSPMLHIGEEVLRVTVSIGVSETRRRKIDLEALLQEADDALYRAKHSGRNRVVCADSSGSGTSAE